MGRGWREAGEPSSCITRALRNCNVLFFYFGWRLAIGFDTKLLVEGVRSA